MKFSAGVLAAITPMAALAFMQPNALKYSANINQQILGLDDKSSKQHHAQYQQQQQQQQQSRAMSELKMAFNLKEGETSNMFEGPAPLTKERDACGVGFIANTKEGGKECFVLFI